MSNIRFVFGRRYKLVYQEQVDEDTKGPKVTVEANYHGEGDFPGIVLFGNRKKTELKLWREEILKAELVGDAVWR